MYTKPRKHSFRPAAEAIQFTVDQAALRVTDKAAEKEKRVADMVCSIDNRDECLACGS